MRRGDTQARGRGDVSQFNAEPLGAARWDWSKVRRVLVVRLRSIGDTVLSTPSLVALRRFLPDAQIDVLLEDWVAPVLDGFDQVDNVLTVKRANKRDRLRLTAKLRASRYDVAYNLHGGTTAGFFTFASGARHRVGFANYRYQIFYNFRAPSPFELWNQKTVHSVENQLALVGWTGVPVSDKPKTHLAVTEAALNSIENKLKSKIKNQKSKIALLHPATAFETKQWATENFARAAEYLHERGFQSIALAAPKEGSVLENLKQLTRAPIQIFADLSLPEITALASTAQIFVGNDSGIAHLAAAVGTPSVVVFGSSNVGHWRPWTDAPNEIVSANLQCAPCAGYFCKEFHQPECIRRVTVEQVTSAVEKVLNSAKNYS